MRILKMSRIVQESLKIDLHIHSVHSSHKEAEGYEIEYNTKENLGLLLNKLETNKVNIAAITDHNVFSYEMYQELVKISAESEIVQKVLPGVELDVWHKDKHIHVVCIFDDNDQKKLADLESYLRSNQKDIYDESELHSMFSSVKLGVLLIPHQKDRIEKPRERDLANVGLSDFTDSVSYFDAVEFKSYKIEPYLKQYQEKNLKYFSRITGTDCHNWNVYPLIDSKSEEKECLDTFIRSLPTFRGLVMALTEHTRISHVKRKYGQAVIEELSFKGLEEPVKLSSRINVIIGDNSIGKSAILHKLTQYKYIRDSKEGSKSLTDIYDDFLTNRLGFANELNEEQIKIAKFESQGAIRKLFQNSLSLVENEIVKKYFNDFDYDGAVDTVLKEAYDYFEAVEHNDKVSKQRVSLNESLLTIPDTISSNYFPSFRKLYSGDEAASVSDHSRKKRILKKLKDAEVKVVEAKELETDSTILLSFDIVENGLKKLIGIYDTLVKKAKVLCDSYRLIDGSIDKVKTVIATSQSDNDALSERYNTQIEVFTKKILNYKLELDKDVTYGVRERIEFKGNPNSFGNFEFINQPSTLVLEEEDINRILSYGFINRYKARDSINDSIEDIKFKIGYDMTKSANVKDFFVGKVKKELKQKELKPNVDIKYKSKSKSSNKSAGSNALIYLDLLSEDIENKLIILDQPEDDVSQGKISTDLIEIIRRIALDRQMIIITHNPQLVVNLDVDNVVCLKYDESDNITVTSGALEFQSEREDILRDVAEILDGGTDSIMRRWKVYDKTR